jgi:hypothetical protein
MVKAPINGEVKTRLIEKIGEYHSTELYKRFLLDIVEKIEEIDTPTIIYYTPESELENLTSLLGNSNKYVHQKGKDLGERLLNGFRYTKKLGYKTSFALATDVPDLPTEILNESINSMEEDGAVIGPSPDGGYYLIGLKNKFLDEDLFSGIEWGTDSVFERTIKKLEDKNIRTKILEPWMDIDTYEDLRMLSKDNAFEGSKTFKYLEKNPEILF